MEHDFLYVEQLEKEIELLKSKNQALRRLVRDQAQLNTDIGDLILFSLDKEYRYIAFNKLHAWVMRKIWNREIQVGVSMLEYINLEQDRQKAKINFDRALAGEEFMLVEEYGDYSYARLFWENTYKPLFDSTGQQMGISVYVKDITQLKRNEFQLKQQNDLLDFAKKEADKSNRLKNEFLRNLSHEIRTPLNAIIGFSSFLDQKDLEEEKREEFVNIINRSSDQLVHVIEQILEISAYENRNVEVEEVEIGLTKLLLEVYTVFHPIAQERKLHLYISEEAQNNDTIFRCDKSKLRKIIANLIENAIKFTYKGEIELGYRHTSDGIEIFVRDTGIGITKEKQKSIFDLFSQEASVLTDQYGGLGLGLCIVKENVELLGGKIEIESEKDEGTTFKVLLNCC